MRYFWLLKIKSAILPQVFKYMKPLVTIAFSIGFWGPTADEFFKRIKSQKIKYPYEIVAVYHGSDEKLYKKLKTLVSKIVRIKPEEYNGGATRDLACSLASGDYIANLGVDSIPLNSSWLKNMVEPLMDDSADVVQGMMQCPERDYSDYPDFFYWEREFGFYFTSEGQSFFKKYGFFGKYGYWGFAAPNLSFKKAVWKNTGFSGARYNEDKIFQKRVVDGNFKSVLKENAIVLHAHLYTTVKSLFNRCSNEGIGWKELGENYGFLTMLKDISRIDLHLKALKAYMFGDIQYKSELFFIFIRPIAVYWGNHYAKTIYNDRRPSK